MTLTDNQLSFKTVVKGIDVSCVDLAEYLGVTKDTDFEETAEVMIEWELTSYVRSYGIEYFSPVITRVTGTIEWETEVEYLTETEIKILRDNGGREYINGTIGGVLNIDTVNQHWDVGNDLEFGKDGSIYIGDVEIDFSERSILIQ